MPFSPHSVHVREEIEQKEVQIQLEEAQAEKALSHINPHEPLTGNMRANLRESISDIESLPGYVIPTAVLDDVNDIKKALSREDTLSQSQHLVVSRDDLKDPNQSFRSLREHSPSMEKQIEQVEVEAVEAQSISTIAEFTEQLRTTPFTLENVQVEGASSSVTVKAGRYIVVGELLVTDKTEGDPRLDGQSLPIEKTAALSAEVELIEGMLVNEESDLPGGTRCSGIRLRVSGDRPVLLEQTDNSTAALKFGMKSRQSEEKSVAA